ncbi:MAG: hypothetical protein ACLP5E_21025, partial [Streptosporangiaceae bacterium]
MTEPRTPVADPVRGAADPVRGAANPVRGAAEPVRGAADPAAAIQRARDGDARALGRLLSLVENGAPQLRAVMKALAPLTGHARLMGLTGAPGVGKSTLTSALVAAYRKQGLRVGV